MEKNKKSFYERFSQTVTHAAGSTAAFSIALLAVVVWACTGPIFDFSETWQLVINTGTTIITFLMVFLIQKSQNRDSGAVQLKLDEILAANEFASNRMIDVEDLTEEELNTLKTFYADLKNKVDKEDSPRKMHSIDEDKPDKKTKKSQVKTIPKKVKKTNKK